MKLIHAALRVTTSEEADRFYGELLALPLVREYTIRQELTSRLFGIDRDYQIRLYDTGGTFLEVFVGEGERPGQTLDHVCLQVDDRESLKTKAREMGFRVVEIEREGTHDLVFIYDTDGNVFEIK